ncbi:MAG: radical SAM protein [Nitrospinae bacterium]|nr:radical SAM protein [Nitrospinota bacterium]
MKTKTHMILPVFIPHLGCPYRCVFCNQTDITGSHEKADEKKVLDTLNTYLGDKALSELPLNREVAFYGGSFTGLPPQRQESLLDLVAPWIQQGLVSSIRLSTHPLFIDDDRLALLKKYDVKTIELGIQSTDQNVLQHSGRPCTLETIVSAAELIKKNGFRLGLQLMPGLPGDTDQTFQKSVDDTLNLNPDFVRLYPTLVIRHTELFQMYEEGKFVPWSLERTLENLKTAVIKYRQNEISVIRMGLHPDPSMLENYVDGPYHPSLRYLVDCRIGLDEMIEQIKGFDGLTDTVKFKFPSRSTSIYIGHKRENLQKLKEMFHLENIIMQPDNDCDQLQLIA